MREGHGRQRSAHAGDRRRRDRAQGRGARPRGRDDLGAGACRDPVPVSALGAARRAGQAGEGPAGLRPRLRRLPGRDPARPGARGARVLRDAGQGEPPDPDLVRRGPASSSKTHLQERFGRPTRVANDADVQGCAVVDRHRHGARDHPRDRGGLRGVLRRRAAAAHGAVATAASPRACRSRSRAATTTGRRSATRRGASS